MALLYEGMGIILGYIIKQFFWVPHRFRYGIIVAGGWGNVGDLRECIQTTSLNRCSVDQNDGMDKTVKDIPS